MTLPAPRSLLTLEEYRAEVLRLLPPLAPPRRVPLAEAAGEVLAAPVASRIAIPGFDNSAMDGYAVRFADVARVPVGLRVVAEQPAGSPQDPAAGPGECVRIMTGAAVPGFADTIVPVEDTDGGTDRVEVRVAPAGPGQHIRRAGEDLSAGDPVVESGTVVTPGVLGALAAVGLAQVAVSPRPMVAIAATGDELVDAGEVLLPGQLHDSNSLVLAALATANGAVVGAHARLGDQPDALRDWLDEVAPVADLVVLAGGASVGAHDVVRDVLTDQAEGVFRHVRMQPGKPQGWAVWPGGTPVIALPGNPLSAALSFWTFVRPMLFGWQGRPLPAPLTAMAAQGWTSPAGRRQLVPVRLSTSPDGRLLAHPAHRRGSASHMVTALVGADAIAQVPEDVERVVTGDLLAVELIA